VWVGNLTGFEEKAAKMVYEGLGHIHIHEGAILL